MTHNIIKIGKASKGDFVEKIKADAYKKGQEDLLLDIYYTSRTPPHHIAALTSFSADYVGSVIFEFEREMREKKEKFASEVFEKRLKWMIDQRKKEGLQKAQEAVILDIFKKKGWSAIQIADIISLSVEYIQSVIDKYEKNGAQQS